MRFVPHIQPLQYPAGALTAAMYMISGVRSMECGTVSMDRDKDGNEVPSNLELARFAVPRRVFSMSQIEFVVDRLTWLYKQRALIGGLKFVEEQPALRSFLGKMETVDS